jgi:N6-L-threonylcarbamoyladenine synthase
MKRLKQIIFVAVMQKPIYILAIESSCDDTSAAILCDRQVLSNVIANQQVHEDYGGVVPELASRAHQQNIVPVVQAAMKRAGVTNDMLGAIAFTRGPGLIGSLLVGVTFAKSLGLALKIPLIEVDHLEAHVLAHFIEGQHTAIPVFPFLCLTVSGGHTQIIRVESPFKLEIIGNTIDDAAGEAFDKAAKIMGLPYPGGPLIDKLAAQGDPRSIKLAKAKVPGLDYSFSGLKTSFLYHVRDHIAGNPDYIEQNKTNLAASMQTAIIESLMEKLILAARQTGIRQVALAGGVSANSQLRKTVEDTGQKLGWQVFIPEFRYTTDNAAMIGIAAWFKYQDGIFTGQEAAPYASAAKRASGKP